MMAGENLKLALGSFAHGKLRTLLSALGIVIGVMSVITITTLGDSATGSITDSVEDAGLNSITVMRGREAGDDVIRAFDMDFASQIAQVDGVEAVVPLVSAQFTVSHGTQRYDGVEVMGVLPDYANIYQYTPESGTFINESHESDRDAVAVLGAEIANSLFPEGEAVGERIRIFRNQARSFRVVGVMKSEADTMGNSFDSTVYVPASTFDARLQRIDSVREYGVLAKAGADVLVVEENLNTFFTESFEGSDSVRVMSPAGMAEMFSGITQTLNLFLAGVAAISLVVGGIGIMNIMLVSVSERTKEIGIRKALGATPAVIRFQFLTEAALLTTLGGVIGVASGLGLSSLAVKSLGWSFAPDPVAILMAVAFSGGVGLFFGLYPAARASKLDPVDALSHE